MIEYKYREDELLEELKKYIDSTYSEHYVSQDNVQTMDRVLAKGFEHATGFCMGNVGKYGDRYRSKGDSPNVWRKDLIKVLHYTLFQLYAHDREYPMTQTPVEPLQTRYFGDMDELLSPPPNPSLMGSDMVLADVNMSTTNVQQLLNEEKDTTLCK